MKVKRPAEALPYFEQAGRRNSRQSEYLDRKRARQGTSDEGAKLTDQEARRAPSMWDVHGSSLDWALTCCSAFESTWLKRR